MHYGVDRQREHDCTDHVMIAQENRDLFFGYYGVRRHEAVELTFGHIHQFEDRWEVILKRETATRNADGRIATSRWQSSQPPGYSPG